MNLLEQRLLQLDKRLTNAQLDQATIFRRFRYSLVEFEADLTRSKDTHGGECKICERPFTTFRWMPGRGARYKKTEVCQTCAKLKNVCQTCLLDLEYGLPVQVRDAALQVKESIPKVGANRDYFIQNVDRALAETDGTMPYGELAKLTDAGSNEMLRKLARNQPYYNRNLPHICSFFVKGECTRGEEIILDRCNSLLASRSRYTSKEEFARIVLQTLLGDHSIDLLLLKPHFDSVHADALNRLNALIGFESTVFMTIYVNDVLFDEFIELFSRHCIRSPATIDEANESVYMWLLADYLQYLLPVDEQKLNLLKNSTWLSGPLASLPTSAVTSPRRLLRPEVLAQCAPLEHVSLRHEKPTDPDDPLSLQNMRDRYYGTNDPVAEKLMNRAKAMPKLTPPEDQSITTLFLGNLGRESRLIVNEADIRDYFYQFGEIRQVHVVPNKCCAFIQFTTRQATEVAAERTFEQLVLKGLKVRVRWGQPRSQTQATKELTAHAPLEPVPNIAELFPSSSSSSSSGSAPMKKRSRFSAPAAEGDEEGIPLPVGRPPGLVVPELPPPVPFPPPPPPAAQGAQCHAPFVPLYILVEE
uniref:Pre-mRNA-splicing factor RBM22 n=1 Tax=Globodera pallida TaxID=36090 RepID=A0A183C0R8_GLOPA